MDITWYGRSCFRISERGHTTVVTDPHKPNRGAPELKLRADLVAISHEMKAHRVEQVKDCDYVISSPGEYEIGELFVTGTALHIFDSEREAILKNIAYLFEYPNQLNVLHLGKLREMPDQSIFEQIDIVHVLLLPVDGAGGLRGEQMTEIISLIEPNIVVPMNHGAGTRTDSDMLDGFLKAMGIGQIEAEDSLRVTVSTLPEQTQVVLLRPNIASN